MMGFDPDDTSVRDNHDGHKPNTMQEQNDPMIDALTMDATAWRAERAETVSAIEQRLAGSLRFWRASSDNFHVSALTTVDATDDEVGMDTENQDETPVMDAETRISPLEPGAPTLPNIKALQRKPRGWIAAAVAAVILFGLVGSLFALRGGLGGIGAHAQATATGAPNYPFTATTMPNYAPSEQAPGIWMYSAAAAAGKTTPQQALDAGFRLIGCDPDVARGATPTTGSAPLAYKLTWLYNQPTTALAYLALACGGSYTEQIELNMFRDSVGNWQVSGGGWSYITFQEPAPTWLDLPATQYMLVGGDLSVGPNKLPPSITLIWGSTSSPTSANWSTAPSRFYAVAHYREQAAEPSGAKPFTINGRAGWVLQQNNIVSVTEPLADGTVAFFSGTDSIATIERLAPAAIAHLFTPGPSYGLP